MRASLATTLTHTTSFLHNILQVNKWVKVGRGGGRPRGNWARGESQAGARRPNFSLRDSWQVCPFLSLQFKDPFKVLKKLDGVPL